MKNYTILKNSAGFTLIELMVVVGIIGILAMVAIPNFSRYQAKARQSEAKIALAGVYTAQKSFMSEYSSYINSMDAIGYAPEGQKRNYNVGFDSFGADVTISTIGYSGATTTQFYAAVNNTMTCGSTGTVASNGTNGAGQHFNVSANGCIKNAGSANDTWIMTDVKVLSNTVIGY